MRMVGPATQAQRSSGVDQTVAEEDAGMQTLQPRRGAEEQVKRHMCTPALLPGMIAAAMLEASAQSLHLFPPTSEAPQCALADICTPRKHLEKHERPSRASSLG
jgi:hypothetical protein